MRGYVERSLVNPQLRQMRRLERFRQRAPVGVPGTRRCLRLRAWLEGRLCLLWRGGKNIRRTGRSRGYGRTGRENRAGIRAVASCGDGRMDKLKASIVRRRRWRGRDLSESRTNKLSNLGLLVDSISGVRLGLVGWRRKTSGKCLDRSIGVGGEALTLLDPGSQLRNGNPLGGVKLEDPLQDVVKFSRDGEDRPKKLGILHASTEG